MSLDGVAEESVSADFFGNHYGTGTAGQDYIVDAADSGAGVEEHWNNSVAKQYSRNLSTSGTGIELVCLSESPVIPVPAAKRNSSLDVHLFGTTLLLNVPAPGEYRLSLHALDGRIAARWAKHALSAGSVAIPLAGLHLSPGIYAAEVESPHGILSAHFRL